MVAFPVAPALGAQNQETSAPLPPLESKTMQKAEHLCKIFTPFILLTPSISGVDILPEILPQLPCQQMGSCVIFV